MTSSAPPIRSHWSILRPATWAQMGRDLAYLLPGFVLALASFSVMISLLAVGVSTLIIFAGLPILVFSLVVARWFADRNLSLLRRWGGPVPPTLYEPAEYGSILGMVDVLRDGQRWRNAAHVTLVSFVYRLFAFTIVITWLAFVLVGLTDWAWGPHVAGYESLPVQMGLGGASSAAEIAASLAIGVVSLVLLPVVLRALALGDAALARALLTNENASLRARGEKLTAQRAQVVAEEASTLRKVERDLHDGPQQRLIRLQMDIQGAQRRIDSDPAAARVLMGEALEQSAQALAELRALSRGIAPPILADRGLVAAVDGLAARSTVPVRVHSELPSGARLPEAAENAAYFVVAESLANIAKHAEASSASVTIAATDDALMLQIDDDGVGGAHPGKGHGLSGLIDRLAGVDGQLHVDSPVGGPTRIQATIDLA